MPTVTIYAMLRETVAKFADRKALSFSGSEGLVHITYSSLWNQVRQVRRGLVAAGMARGDRLAIISYNCVEWAVSDLAAHALGAVTVPIYHTLPASQIEYLIRDSHASIVVVEDAKQFTKVQQVRASLPEVRHVVVMHGEAPEGSITFDQLVGLGAGLTTTDEDLDTKAEQISPNDLATLIYTSGTTGEPKGAMLSHRALLHTSWAARDIVDLDETDVFLSFLPLCHVVERVGGHYLPLTLGAQIIYSGGPFTIASEISAVRPTVFLCVPRLYEAIQDRVLDVVRKAPALRRAVANWAMRVGAEYAGVVRTNGRVGAWLRLRYSIADKVALATIRSRATGGRVRFLVSGGAPLSASTFAFFDSIGVQILEGYGLTEFPVISINRPAKRCPVTVGQVLRDVEVMVGPDGELMARGPSMMDGYYGKPEATAEAINSEGWFLTGDIGEVGSDGVIRITDRKKDIIVLANGKNVAPQPIEARLKLSQYISEAVILGDRQAVLFALIVPQFDAVSQWAHEHGIRADDREALASDPEIKKLIKQEVAIANAELADYERIKRFELLATPFSIESGELTPTLKVRRRVVSAKYAHLMGGVF